MNTKYDKAIVIGTIVAVIMLPVIAAGLLFRPIKLYFDEGMNIADKVGEMIVDYLDK